MGLFPTDANDGDEVTNSGGTTFKYVAVDDKWIIVNTITISDDVYGGDWDANPDAASKNAIFDIIETIMGGGDILPIGTILMYNGVGWEDNTTMVGWYICNATNEIAHGTPNLTNKFVRSEASSGNTGGVDSNTLVGNNIPLHNHESAGYHRHSVKTYTAMPNAAGGNNPGGFYGAQLGDQRYTNYVSAHTHSNFGLASPNALDNKPAYYSLIFVMKVS